MTIKGYGVLVAIGAGALLAFIAYRALKGGLTAAAEAVNPLSDKNAAYTGVNAVGATVTGNKDFSLGSAIFDWFNPEYDPNADAPITPVVIQSRKQAVSDNYYDRGVLF